MRSKLEVVQIVTVINAVAQIETVIRKLKKMSDNLSFLENLKSYYWFSSMPNIEMKNDIFKVIVKKETVSII